MKKLLLIGLLSVFVPVTLFSQGYAKDSLQFKSESQNVLEAGISRDSLYKTFLDIYQGIYNRVDKGHFTDSSTLASNVTPVLGWTATVGNPPSLFLADGTNWNRLTVSGSGLTQVETDASLDGIGTVADPLGVAGDAIDSTMILAGAVRSGEILDGTIATVDLADDIINSAKIINNTITAADQVQIAAYTLVGNPTGSLADRAVITIAALSSESTPSSGDLLLLADGITGELKKLDYSVITSGGGGGGPISADATLQGDGTSGNLLGIADQANNTLFGNISGSVAQPVPLALADYTEELTPTTGDHVVGILADGSIVIYDVGNLPTGGGGEINTISSIGTGGVSIVDGKVGVDLQLKSITSDDASITLTDDVVNDNVDLSLSDNSVTSSKIVTDAVGASEIVAGAVGTSEVADNSLTAVDIAANAITASELADDAVDAGALADAIISPVHFVNAAAYTLFGNFTGVAAAPTFSTGGTLALDNSPNSADFLFGFVGATNEIRKYPQDEWIIRSSTGIADHVTFFADATSIAGHATLQFNSGNVRLTLGGIPATPYGSITAGQGLIRLGDAVVVPDGTLTSGGLIYVSGTSLFFHADDGTVTDLTSVSGTISGAANVGNGEFGWFKDVTSNTINLKSFGNSLDGGMINIVEQGDSILLGVTDGSLTTAKIGDDQITYAKIQNVVANNVLLGTNSGAGTIVEELTAAEVRTILNVADGANNYVHPNLTGEVTSTGEASTVIASSVVDSDNIVDGTVAIADLDDIHVPFTTETTTALAIDNTDVTHPLRVAKILYNPPSAGVITVNSGTAGDKIEIKNISTQNVSIVSGTATVQDPGSLNNENQIMFLQYETATQVKAWYESDGSGASVTTSLPQVGDGTGGDPVTTALQGITTAYIADDNVTWAKIENAGAYTLLGRNAGTSGDIAPFTIDGLTDASAGLQDDDELLIETQISGDLRKIDLDVFVQSPAGAPLANALAYAINTTTNRSLAFNNNYLVDNVHFEMFGREATNPFGATSAGQGVLRLNDVTAVPIGTMGSGGLIYVQGTSLWFMDDAGTKTDLVAAGVTTLGGLTDVTLTTPASDQGLFYNGSLWVNQLTQTANIADNAITEPKIASNAVTSSEIAAGAVGSSEIATDAVGSLEIAAGAVGQSEIATGAVTTSEIADLAVGTADIGNAQVTTAKLANDAVDNTKLANMNQNTIKGRITASAGDPEDLTAAQIRTIINVADGANNYVHPNHTGEVTSTGDGATVIASSVVDSDNIVNGTIVNADLANMAANSIKGNVGAIGVAEDIIRTTLSEELAPGTGDRALGWDETGNLVYFDVTNFGGGDHTINGASLAANRIVFGFDADEIQAEAGFEYNLTDNLLTVEEILVDTVDYQYMIGDTIIVADYINPVARKVNERSIGGTTGSTQVDDETIKSTGASDHTFTVNPNSTTAFPVGHRLFIYKYGTGDVKILRGTGVNFQTADTTSAGEYLITKPFGVVVLEKDGTDNWILTGDLAGGDGYGAWQNITFATGWQNFSGHTAQFRINKINGETYVQFNGAYVQWTGASASDNMDFWDVNNQTGLSWTVDKRYFAVGMGSAATSPDSEITTLYIDATDDIFKAQKGVSGSFSTNDNMALPTQMYKVD